MAIRPKVAVVIPALNRPELLARAIESVKAQRKVEPQIVVVDDASTVDLRGRLGPTLVRDVMFVRNPERRNAAYSRNRGVSMVDGELLAFLDSDDFWFPNHLHTALSSLNEFGASALFVSRYGVAEALSPGAATFCRDGYRFLFERVGDPRSSTLVCSRELFYSVGGFDARLDKHQDWDFALRCSKRSGILLGGSTTVFIDGEAAGRMSERANLEASRRFLDKHGPTMTAAQLSRFFFGLLLSSARTSSVCHARARELFKEYIRLEDFPLRYWALVFNAPIGLLITDTWLFLKRALGRGAKRSGF